VAGYVLAELGRLPEVGDTIDVEGRTLTVLELDGRRIARLLVAPMPAPADQADAGAGGHQEAEDAATGTPAP
jgi:putative hemolysin